MRISTHQHGLLLRRRILAATVHAGRMTAGCQTPGSATSVPGLSVAVSFETDTELLIGQRLVFQADFRPVEIQKSFHQVI